MADFAQPGVVMPSVRRARDIGSDHKRVRLLLGQLTVCNFCGGGALRCCSGEITGIEIQEFVNEAEISSLYFEKPHYLKPDIGAGKAFALGLLQRRDAEMDRAEGKRTKA